MKKEDAPQDGKDSTYGVSRKLIYVTDESGDFTSVKSSGWKVETHATRSAIEFIDQQRDEALRRAYQGKSTTLEYYMYFRRMDISLLSQTTGLFQWRIRRHFKPRVFKKLSASLLERYSEALDLDIQTLQTLPEQPLDDSNL